MESDLRLTYGALPACPCLQGELRSLQRAASEALDALAAEEAARAQAAMRKWEAAEAAAEALAERAQQYEALQV